MGVDEERRLDLSDHVSCKLRLDGLTMEIDRVFIQFLTLLFFPNRDWVIVYVLESCCAERNLRSFCSSTGKYRRSIKNMSAGMFKYIYVCSSLFSLVMYMYISITLFPSTLGSIYLH